MRKLTLAGLVWLGVTSATLCLSPGTSFTFGGISGQGGGLSVGGGHGLGLGGGHGGGGGLGVGGGGGGNPGSAPAATGTGASVGPVGITGAPLGASISSAGGSAGGASGSSAGGGTVGGSALGSMPGLPNSSTARHRDGGVNPIYSPEPSAVTRAAQAELNGLPALPKAQSASPIAAPLDNVPPAVAAVTQPVMAVPRPHVGRQHAHRFDLGLIGSTEQRASSDVPKHAKHPPSLVTTLVPAESEVDPRGSAMALADLPPAAIVGPPEPEWPVEYQASFEAPVWHPTTPGPEPFALAAFLAFSTIGGYWFARRLRG